MQLDYHTLESLCKEAEEMIMNKYFGNLIKAAAHERPESIGNYTPDLPYMIELEYKEMLDFMVKHLFPGDNTIDVNSFLEEEKLRLLMTEDDREEIESAYKKATQRTVIERLTKTNHSDVTFYKGLLEAHTKDLLLVMRTDFLEELTGKYIKNKTFEDD